MTLCTIYTNTSVLINEQATYDELWFICGFLLYQLFDHGGYQYVILR